MNRRKFIAGTIGVLAGAAVIPWKKKSSTNIGAALTQPTKPKWDSKFVDTVDKELTDISLKYIQESEPLVASQVFPIVTNEPQTLDVTVYPLTPDDYVYLTPSNGTTTTTATTDSYYTFNDADWTYYSTETVANATSGTYSVWVTHDCEISVSSM